MKRKRYNPSSILGARVDRAFKSPTQRGAGSGFKIGNMVGVVPVVAGVAMNNLLTNALAKQTKYTQGGIGKYALGLIDAGLLYWGTSYLSKNASKGVLVGAMVEVLGEALKDMMMHGVVGALKPTGIGAWSDDGMSSWDQPVWNAGFQGMNNFLSPREVQSAVPSMSPFTQYAMPEPNAVQAPPPPMPPQAHPGGGGHHVLPSGQMSSMSEEDAVIAFNQ